MICGGAMTSTNVKAQSEAIPAASLSVVERPRPPTERFLHPYKVLGNRLYMEQTVKNHPIDKKLCNFAVWIIEEIIQDDGIKLDSEERYSRPSCDIWLPPKQKSNNKNQLTNHRILQCSNTTLPQQKLRRCESHRSHLAVRCVPINTHPHRM